MNSQSDSINEQTSRSLVEREDPIVQSSTNGVGPSTGQEDRRVDMLLMDEERCHIIHTLTDPHPLPVKLGAQATAALRSMQPGDMVQLSRHRPVEEGSRICWTVDVRLYNGRFRGWDFETEAKMTKKKMALLDTGRVVQQDIRINSTPVPESDLVRFHMCGPPDCDYDEVREWCQQIAACLLLLHKLMTGSLPMRSRREFSLSWE